MNNPPKHKNAKTSPDLCFLFASPRYFRLIKPKYEEFLPETTYRREFDELQKIIHTSGRQVRFHKLPATAQLLEECLQDGARFIHVSCRGESEANLKEKLRKQRYNKDRLDIWFEELKMTGDYLLFEDRLGNTAPLYNRHLTQLTRQTKVSDQVQCVFLAAGNSESHGRILSSARVPHVICTRRPVNEHAQ